MHWKEPLWTTLAPSAVQRASLLVASSLVSLHGQASSVDSMIEVVMVTASPYEAQDYSDNGEDIVEKVMMTPQVHAWISAYVDTHHEEEAFVKRRRDKYQEPKQDGIGDARISQTTDVYRAPRTSRSGSSQ